MSEGFLSLDPKYKQNWEAVNIVKVFELQILYQLLPDFPPHIMPLASTIVHEINLYFVDDGQS